MRYNITSTGIVVAGVHVHLGGRIAPLVSSACQWTPAGIVLVLAGTRSYGISNFILRFILLITFWIRLVIISLSIFPSNTQIITLIQEYKVKYE